MTYKQIEAAREARLWIGQIIIPALGLCLMSPEVRATIKSKANELKCKFMKN